MIRFAVVLLALSACGAKMDPARAADQCEERARAAQGPTGSVTIGSNSNTGPFTKAEIGITSDFLRGEDPDLVFDRCVIGLTGEGPIRRPVLRNM